jgi:hypothetical protein
VAVPGNGRQHGAEAQEVALGAVEPLHRLVCGDDLRIDLRELVVRQTPPLDYSRRDVRQEHVRPLYEPVGDSLPFIRVEVQEDAEFAGVVVVEIAADVVAGLPLGERRDGTQRVDVRLRLHTHDGRAVVGEHPPADRPRAEPREVGDLHAVERSAS